MLWSGWGATYFSISKLSSKFVKKCNSIPFDCRSLKHRLDQVADIENLDLALFLLHMLVQYSFLVCCPIFFSGSLLSRFAAQYSFLVLHEHLGYLFMSVTMHNMSFFCEL